MANNPTVWAVVEDSMMLRMLCVAIVAGLMFGLGGCHHARYIQLRKATAEELKEQSTEDLLWAAGTAANRRAVDNTLLDELAIRYEWTDEQLERIKNRELYRGYTKEMLIAVRGRPGWNSTRHVDWRGKTESLDYGNMFIHMSNGVVTGWTTF